MGKKVEVEVKFPVRFQVDSDSFKVSPAKKKDLVEAAREILDSGDFEEPEVKESPEI